MKNLIVLAIMISVFVACGDNCEDTAPVACSDIVPMDEACQAFFTRWFYDAETESCERIGYSGCNQVGFETESACKACACN